MSSSSSSSSDVLVPAEKFTGDLQHVLTPEEVARLGICPEWASNLKQVLFTKEQIQAKVNEHYRGRKVLCVGLLTGAFLFVADLLREVTVPYEIDFMTLSSYGKGTTSTGSVKLKKDLSIDPKDRDILIIEDLIDTGNTLAWLKEHFRTKQCKSVRICCLLDKTARRTSNVHVDFVGYECPDEFVVGYGMDFADAYRCVPFIGVLKPEAYAKL